MTNAELAQALSDVSDDVMRLLRAAVALRQQLQENAAGQDSIYDPFPGETAAALAELVAHALAAHDVAALRRVMRHFPELGRRHGLE